MYACVSVYGYMHISAGTPGGQQRASDPLQEVINHLRGVLGSDLEFTEGIVHAISHFP